MPRIPRIRWYRVRFAFRHPIRWSTQFSAWLLARIFSPLELHPEELYGYDGEPPYFVRADRAATRGEACERLVESWGWDAFLDSLPYMEPISDMRIVWMVEGDDSTEDEPWYNVVPARTRKAIPYWQWRD